MASHLADDYRTMVIPLLILVTAAASMAFTAFGADPRWAAYPHGLEIIMLSRRLQWPLVTMAMLGCTTLCVMVISGRKRAWWLIGLAPVLALFVHRFVIDPTRSLQVDAEANFVAADHAKFIDDHDFVVGLNFEGDDYAFPYNILYETPVVAIAKPGTRLVLIWSAFANRAMAVQADWNLKPRELEIVSQPANALLVYNTRLGQFINGVTGQTPEGRRPSGFGAEIPTRKMIWKTWKSLHPSTLVLQPPDGWMPGAPTQPVMPMFPMPGKPSAPMSQVSQVALIDTPRPTLIEDSAVGSAPLNLMAGGDPILLFRTADGSIKGFIRLANGDLTPRFFPMAPVGHSLAVLTEHDSGSAWTAEGRAVDGPLKGEKLQPLEVDDQVYSEVIRFWYPQASEVVVQPSDVGKAPAPPVAAKSAKRRRPIRKSKALAGPIRIIPSS